MKFVALVALAVLASANADSSIVITHIITASYSVTAAQWTVNGVDCVEKALSECAYAKAIGVATFEASGCVYANGASVDTTAASSRRANSLVVTYTATVSASQASAATTAAGAITPSSFQNVLESARGNTFPGTWLPKNVAVGGLSFPPPTPTSSDSSGSFGFGTMGIIAVVLVATLLMISFCAILCFTQSTKKPEVDVHMDQKATV